MNRQVLIVIAMLSVSGLSWAEEPAFDTEEMVNALEERLRLSAEELERAQPELEKALDEKSQELEKAISQTIEQGFLELDKLSEQLNAASLDAEREIRAFLDSEQYQELRAFLLALDGDAVASVRNELVKQITELLELSRAQIDQLTPIIEDGLRQQGEILQRYAREGEALAQRFKRDYDELAGEMKKRLEESLDSEQIQKLEERQDEIRREMLQKLLPESES